MNTDWMLSVYGIDRKIADQFPTPPIESREIECKFNVIDWCKFMRQDIDSIERSFRGAPLTGEENHAEAMERVRDQVRRAMLELNQAKRMMYL